MLADNEKKELINKLKRAKEEISAVKSKLSKANSEKEALFRQKAAVSQEIKDKINFVQEAKKKRNNLTSEVKGTKVKRDQLNKQISEELKIVKDIKEVTPVSHVPESYNKPKDSPATIKKKIETLETKIETEPMSFQKEQVVMKEIRFLKKQYNQIKDATSEISDIRSKNRELNKLKKEANKLHRDLQKQAKESQEFHEQLIEYSKEIDILREKEKASHELFLERKKSYMGVNNELKVKLEEFKKVKEELESNDVQVAELEHEKKKKNLKEKTKEVNDKIKKRHKLTTEDLLVMQQGK